MGSAFSSPTHTAISVLTDVHMYLVDVLLTP